MTSGDVAAREEGSSTALGIGASESAAASTAAPSSSVPAVEPRRWWRDALRRRILALADVLTALLAAFAVAPSLRGLAWGAALVPLWILLAKLLGLYDRDHRVIRHLTVDEAAQITIWVLCGSAALALVLEATAIGEPTLGGFARAFLVAGCSAFLLRAVARWLWRRLVPPERTALVGGGEVAEMIRRKLGLFRDVHLEITDEVSKSEVDLLGAEEPRLERLAESVDRIVVASDQVNTEVIGRLLASCRRHQAKLSVVSPLRGRALPIPQMTQLADLSMFEFDTWDVSRSTQMLKRAFDLAFSVVGLVLVAPLLPLIAVAIKFDSKGGVIFSQVRAGRDERPFRMYKFRTMAADAEARLGEVVSLDSLHEPMFKVKGDPRMTRVGRQLRRFSLDELPQLWNILVGEMSVVGPRPEQLEVVRLYRPEHRVRLTVKPGLTGPMQVYGRGELTFQERLTVELDYIENISLPRDLRILALTIPGVLRGTGAY